MLLIFLEVALSFILASILGLLIYARWNYGTLEALNVPVAKRSFFLGSTPDLHKTVQHLEDIRRYKKYGPIYGVYEGRTPHIHICDPEIIRMIFVRDFDHFRDRRVVNLGHGILDHALDFLPYDQWKVFRQMATPSLTSSKLKMMSDRVKEISMEFLPHLEKEVKLGGGRVKVDSRKVFVPISVDTIIRGLCGIKVRDPFDYGGAVCQNAEALTADGGEPSMMYTLGATFPLLSFFCACL
jgi:cytochrome P450 family 3 subfamily A